MTTTDDKCKQCGACRTCDICACCGKCRECGKAATVDIVGTTVNPPTFIPIPYPVPQPYPRAPSPGIPWWDQYAPSVRPIWMVEPWPTITCDTFTLTDGAVQ